MVRIPSSAEDVPEFVLFHSHDPRYSMKGLKMHEASIRMQHLLLLLFSTHPYKLQALLRMGHRIERVVIFVKEESGNDM
jgi:hypothetical protein